MNLPDLNTLGPDYLERIAEHVKADTPSGYRIPSAEELEEVNKINPGKFADVEAITNLLGKSLHCAAIGMGSTWSRWKAESPGFKYARNPFRVIGRLLREIPDDHPVKHHLVKELDKIASNIHFVAPEAWGEVVWPRLNQALRYHLDNSSCLGFASRTTAIWNRTDVSEEDYLPVLLPPDFTLSSLVKRSPEDV